MPHPWLAAITSGPTVAPLRADAAALTYVVARSGRRAAAVRREAPDGASVELARSAGRLRAPDWSALAAAILRDATGAAPPVKLASDLGRFIVARPGAERRLGGEDLAAWLASWRSGIAALLRGR